MFSKMKKKAAGAMSAAASAVKETVAKKIDQTAAAATSSKKKLQQKAAADGGGKKKGGGLLGKLAVGKDKRRVKELEVQVEEALRELGEKRKLHTGVRSQLSMIVSNCERLTDEKRLLKKETKEAEALRRKALVDIETSREKITDAREKTAALIQNAVTTRKGFQPQEIEVSQAEALVEVEAGVARQAEQMNKAGEDKLVSMQEMLDETCRAFGVKIDDLRRQLAVCERKARSARTMEMAFEAAATDVEISRTASKTHHTEVRRRLLSAAEGGSQQHRTMLIAELIRNREDNRALIWKCEKEIRTLQCDPRLVAESGHAIAKRSADRQVRQLQWLRNAQVSQAGLLRQLQCTESRHEHFLAVVESGDVAEVRRLLHLDDETIATVTSKTGDGRTGLHVAAAHGHRAMAVILLDAGVPISSGADRGLRTALHCAAASGQFDMVQFCLKNGARVDAKDQRGQTALHASAATSATLPVSAEIVQELLDAGADARIIDDDDFSAEDVARIAHREWLALRKEAEKNEWGKQKIDSLDALRKECAILENAIAPVLDDESLATEADAFEEKEKGRRHRVSQRQPLSPTQVQIGDDAPSTIQRSLRASLRSMQMPLPGRASLRSMQMPLPGQQPCEPSPPTATTAPAPCVPSPPASTAAAAAAAATTSAAVTPDRGKRGAGKRRRRFNETARHTASAILRSSASSPHVIVNSKMG